MCSAHYLMNNIYQFSYAFALRLSLERRICIVQKMLSKLYQYFNIFCSAHKVNKEVRRALQSYDGALLYLALLATVPVLFLAACAKEFLLFIYIAKTQNCRKIFRPLSAFPSSNFAVTFTLHAVFNNLVLDSPFICNYL